MYCPSSPDSIDTPLVMKHMRELVGTCNVYMAEAGGKSPSTLPLANIACYLTSMLDMFGALWNGNGTGCLESRIGFPCTASQGGQSLVRRVGGASAWRGGEVLVCGWEGEVPYH